MQRLSVWRLGHLGDKRDLPWQDAQQRIRTQLNVAALNADHALPLADIKEPRLLMDQRGGRRFDHLVIEGAQLAPVKPGAFIGLHGSKVFHRDPPFLFGVHFIVRRERSAGASSAAPPSRPPTVPFPF